MNSALMLHRHARPAVAGAYTLGAISGAALSVSVLLVAGGLLSPVPAAGRGALAIAALVLLLLQATGAICLHLPQRAYQIPRETFNGSPVRAAWRFAAELGTGARTYVTTEAPYGLVVILLLCQPSTLGQAMITAEATAAGFGLGRSRIVAAQAWRRTVAIDHPRRWLATAAIVSLACSMTIAVQYLTRS